MIHLPINKKRLFDLALVFFVIIIFLIPFLFLCIAVRLSSKGPALYWSDRVGLDNKIFKMPKFRTMRIETPNVATHLLDNPTFFYTPIGSFLRKSSYYSNYSRFLLAPFNLAILHFSSKFIYYFKI